MKTITLHMSEGKFGVPNIVLAVVGLVSTATLKEWAAIFAGIMTGLWFLTQIILAIRAEVRKMRAGG